MASFPDVFEDVQKLRRTVSVDLPNRHATAYQPRIFGFHLHDSNPVSAKMAWLRRMRTEPKRTEETNNEDIYKEHNPLSGSD